MSGGPPHLCFYSTRCRYSQAFLEELSRSPYYTEFRFVCVDPSATGVRPALPPYLKAVPTLVIAGEHEPRTDNQVMNWLSERRLLDREPAATLGARPGAAPASTVVTSGSGGPAAFEGFGFGSSSDEGFAYLTDTTEVSKGAMVRMGGGLASLSGGDIPLPGTGAGAGATTAGGKVSAKARAMEDAFEAYRAAREKDMPGPPRPPF